MNLTRRTFLAGGAASALHAGNFKPGFATAKECAEAIRLKKISATELLNETFQRIDLFNPRLNAIILEFREQATARARQADGSFAKGNHGGRYMAFP